MKVIVGLGNPGTEYDKTRHNMGFMCIDRIADVNNINIIEHKFKAIIGKGFIAGQKVILCKPLTFMNNSGESVREVLDYFKLSAADDLIVIYDDIDLDVGKMRIRERGSAGGHNGIKNIIAHTGTQDFKRIRVGVGAKPEGTDLVKHVLGHFNAEDTATLKEVFDKVADAATYMVTDDTATAMNKYN